MPSEVFAELDRLPVGLLTDALEAKAYRQAKAMTDAAETATARSQLPTTRLFRRVTEIEMTLAAEELADG